MSRSFNRRPSPAFVVALLALFVALGGGALAATSFVGSDGQVHACVGKKGQLKVLKPGKKCAKGRSAIAWNQRGQRGVQGTQGVRGIQGVAGPGATSFDDQFEYVPGGTSAEYDSLAPGFRFFATCASTSPQAAVFVQPSDSNNGFYGWGTEAEDGVLSHASASGPEITASGGNSAELDVVAESTAPGAPVRWTRIDATVIRGSKCNFHLMVTPSAG